MPPIRAINEELRRQTTPVDVVRRKYLRQLAELTGRATILYASAFVEKGFLPSALIGIHLQDIQGFMAALHELPGRQLDLVVHSPGGSAQATEQIVNYLRKKFDDIRVIVPQNAMSAATMLACAANRIVMAKHSALGPIDPQIPIVTPGVERYVPAQALLDEFEEAKEAINKGGNPIIWVDKIRQYPPGMLIECNNAIQLSKILVEEWLTKYMFAADAVGGVTSAHRIAEWLGDNKKHLTHGRPIDIHRVRQEGLVVDALEELDEGKLQEAVLSVFHATVLTFATTSCVKIIENQMGRGLYQQVPMQMGKL